MRQLELEQLSELGYVSVHMAALICTVEGRGEDWTEEDLAPFYRLSSELEPPQSSWSATHTWTEIPLLGRAKSRHAEIQGALILSIDRQEIYPLYLRRDKLGRVDPARTRLDVVDFINWTFVHDLLLDDLWDDWFSGEMQVQRHCRAEAKGFRARLARPATEIDFSQIAAKTPKEMMEKIRSLLLENVFLRDGLLFDAETANESPAPERALLTRERDTLLALISVLAEELHLDLGKPSKTAEIVVGLADRRGVKIGIRTVGEHLKAAALAKEKRSI